MTKFRNIKLKVLSREHSAAFQEAALAAGVRWERGKQSEPRIVRLASKWLRTGLRWEVGEHLVQKTDAKYLFISDGPEPRLTWDDNLSVFEKSTHEEILFTTPSYLKTRIRIRDEEHLDFVVERLAENGVFGTQHLTWKASMSLVEEVHIIVDRDGLAQLLYGRPPSWLSFHKVISIEKDGTVTDVPTQNTLKNFAGLEADITARSTDTETSDEPTASRYELPDGATELQHLVSEKNMNAQIGEIFRTCYCYEQVSHSDKLRDAKKILFYINAEIERLEKINENQ